MRNIAHRGASGHRAENTRAAFDLAISMGADAIETDVQITSDGELVLFHDSRVDRTSDGRGPVASYALERLRTLDVGSWAGGDTGPQRVLTLRQMVDEYLGQIPVVFEIKDPRATVATIQVLRDLEPSVGRWEVTSFWWGALLDARAIAPDATLGFLSPVLDEDIVARCVAAGFQQICPNVEALTAEMVQTAHAAGLVVRAFGVRTAADIERLFETGADGATVNWPEWIPERQLRTLE